MKTTVALMVLAVGVIAPAHGEAIISFGTHWLPHDCGGTFYLKLEVTLTEPVDRYEITILSTDLVQWAQVAASLFIVLGVVATASVGTAAAASSAVPGQPLYRIKEFTEEVRLWMERSDEAKVGIYTRFIKERADELKELAETGRSHRSVIALERLEDQITEANALIDKNTERLANDPLRDASDFSEALSAMSTEARSARSTLMETLEQVPAEAQPALQEALALVQQGQDRVRAALEATLGER